MATALGLQTHKAAASWLPLRSHTGSIFAGVGQRTSTHLTISVSAGSFTATVPLVGWPAIQPSTKDEMQAVADALSLLANIAMARMEEVFNHRAQCRGGAIPPELIGHLPPTRTEGFNLRGVFRFPVARYAEKLLPSSVAAKTTASTA